jgi:hypothetical protein
VVRRQRSLSAWPDGGGTTELSVELLAALEQCPELLSIGWALIGHEGVDAGELTADVLKASGGAVAVGGEDLEVSTSFGPGERGRLAVELPVEAFQLAGE